MLHPQTERGPCTLITRTTNACLPTRTFFDTVMGSPSYSALENVCSLGTQEYRRLSKAAALSRTFTRVVPELASTVYISYYPGSGLT